MLKRRAVWNSFSKVFPNDILRALAKYAKNPKASSDTDLNLSLALNKYNKNQCDYVLGLSNGSIFKASNDFSMGCQNTLPCKAQIDVFLNFVHFDFI